MKINFYPRYFFEDSSIIITTGNRGGFTFIAKVYGDGEIKGVK